MLEAVLTTGRQTGILFLLMAFGFAARKARILDDACVRRVTDFVLLVVTPCIIVTSFQRPFDLSMVGGLGWAFAAATFGHLAGIALAHLCVRERNERRRRILRYSVVFSNGGFIGLPLEYALYGSDGVFYGIAYVAMYQVFCWTYGVREMCGARVSLPLRKMLVNPGTVGLMIGMPLFFLPWRLPDLVASPIRTIGELNTPLPMLIIGYHLAGAQFRPALRRGTTYAMLALRHFAVPAVVIGALMLCPFIDVTVRLVTVIPAAAPIGALLTMFAIRYDGDVEYSTALVSVSTLLSIATLPLAVGAAEALFR